VVGQITFKTGRFHIQQRVDDRLVKAFPGGPERVEIVVEDFIQPADAAVPPFDAGYPDAITDKDMIQRAMQGAEKSLPVTVIIVTAEFRGGIIQAVVGPPVIA